MTKEIPRTRSRNNQEKKQRRESILDAALGVFANKGFEKTSMDDIANKAGISRALIYVYFEDKKDIYTSLRVRSVQIMTQRMQANVDINANGMTRVKQVGEAYYQFYLHDKEHFDCLSLDMSLNNQNAALLCESKFDQTALAAEKGAMQIMLDAIDSGLKDGSICKTKVTSPMQTAMFLRGSMHGVIQLQDKDGSALIHKAQVNKEEFVYYALNLMEHALAPD